jgi:hypothetical protein
LHSISAGPGALLMRNLSLPCRPSAPMGSVQAERELLSKIIDRTFQ